MSNFDARPQVLTVPPAHERQIPATSSETSAVNPWPLALLARNLKAHIEKVPQLWVEAQVVSLNNRRGSVFIDLKDLEADATFSLALFGRAAYSIGKDVVPGARVVVLAKPSFWVPSGRLSLVGERIHAVGTGNLHERLQQLREALAAEGLFADSRKKPLPLLPQKVGLVTGRDSDAMKDVIRNASLRWPGVVFEVRQVAVQGANAVREVCAALSELDADPLVDVIVLARGGGSFEDLLPFSDESLVRAVAAAHTPVVSAIGHEADSPIVDAVADVRASTPTDAGKRIVPDVTEEFARISEARGRIDRAIAGYLSNQWQYVQQLRQRPVFTSPENDLGWRADDVHRLRERALVSVQHQLAREQDAVAHTLARVRSLSPELTLRRGYAIVQRADGALVRDASALTVGETLTVRAGVGSADASVTGVHASNVDA